MGGGGGEGGGGRWRAQEVSTRKHKKKGRGGVSVKKFYPVTLSLGGRGHKLDT